MSERTETYSEAFAEIRKSNARIARLNAALAAAVEFRKRVEEIEKSSAWSGVWGLYHVHGGRWPDELTWAKEAAAFDALYAATKGEG